MNYETTCNQNKTLYGLLENFTRQIKQLQDLGEYSQANELQEQKEIVRVLIDNNLESIEAFWETMDKRYRPAERPYLVASELQQQIIDKYVSDPNQSLQSIADALKSYLHKVSRVVTNYLTKKYCEVA